MSKTVFCVWGFLAPVGVRKISGGDCTNPTATGGGGDCTNHTNAGGGGDCTNPTAAGGGGYTNPTTTGGGDCTNLIATAGGAITLDTHVASANLTISGAGSIDLDESDAITLSNVTTQDGNIDVDAGAMTVLTITAGSAPSRPGTAVRNQASTR